MRKMAMIGVALAMASSSGLASADDVLMTVKGEKQGVIAGGVAGSPAATCITVTYETLSPPGKRASRSLSCTMRPAASTPALSRALIEGEVLPEVVFDVVRTGSNEPIYSIRLTRAVISSISERIENGEPFQTVWFDYQTLQARAQADDVPLLVVKPKAKARPKLKLLDVD